MSKPRWGREKASELHTRVSQKAIRVLSFLKKGGKMNDLWKAVEETLETLFFPFSPSSPSSMEREIFTSKECEGIKYLPQEGELRMLLWNKKELALPLTPAVNAPRSRGGSGGSGGVQGRGGPLIRSLRPRLEREPGGARLPQEGEHFR
jgi:hypothetical protein